MDVHFKGETRRLKWSSPFLWDGKIIMWKLQWTWYIGRALRAKKLSIIPQLCFVDLFDFSIMILQLTSLYHRGKLLGRELRGRDLSNSCFISYSAGWLAKILLKKSNLGKQPWTCQGCWNKWHYGGCFFSPFCFCPAIGKLFIYLFIWTPFL